MKKILITWTILLFCTCVHSQEGVSYARLLEKSPEIQLTDSLPVTRLVQHMKALDSNMVVELFSPVVADKNEKVKFKNKDFYTAGKITTNPQYNLHVLVEDKKKDDSLSLRVIYLVTTHKDGAFISSFKAAVTGNKKKSSYNTSSWLFKDLAIVQDSRITTATGSMTDIVKYKITNSGRFMMQLN